MSRYTSWRTTVASFVAAPLLYWASVGFKLPQTGQEWAALGGATAIAALGLNTRDVTASKIEHADQQAEIAAVATIPKVVVTVPPQQPPPVIVP